MFTIRQVVLTHIPRPDMLCYGCGETGPRWSAEHVLERIEANGHDTTKATK